MITISLFSNSILLALSIFLTSCDQEDNKSNKDPHSPKIELSDKLWTFSSDRFNEASEAMTNRESFIVKNGKYVFFVYYPGALEDGGDAFVLDRYGTAILTHDQLSLKEEFYCSDQVPFGDRTFKVDRDNNELTLEDTSNTKIYLGQDIVTDENGAVRGAAGCYENNSLVEAEGFQAAIEAVIGL